jgi:hypothetical protein
MTWSPLPIFHTAEGGLASVDSVEEAIVLSANDDDDFNESSGKSLNFCLQEGQGASPPIIFLAK